MGWFSSGKRTFNWIELTEPGQLDELLEQSVQKPVLLFKHSTRCNISSMAIHRFEQNWNTAPELCDCVYLDLLNHRDISQLIAEKTGVTHQSPQAILIKNKQVVYADSHGMIDATTIQTLL